MPTGGGKSMLFMLPAYAAPGGCTIVVVPLLSLRADLMTRCQGLGISCVSWESRRPPDEAAIVLVTPESTENPDFHTFLNRQRLMRRLDRIAIDECHVILNQQKDFRHAMARLGRLVSARTQLVFLTATLTHKPTSITVIWDWGFG
ncbi:P-loop containing nucleoside triphosphate hydrolase protein [Aspergillus similis]